MALGAIVLTALCASTCYTAAIAQEKPSGKELPQQSEISGITPQVLVRTEVPGAPGKIEIITRTTYRPGAELRRHYHTSQIVFYILEGAMGVQEDGREPVRGGAPVDGATTVGWISKKRQAGGCRQRIPTKKGAAEGALWYFE
jgi:hypothetical protein